MEWSYIIIGLVVLSILICTIFPGDNWSGLILVFEFWIGAGLLCMFVLGPAAMIYREVSPIAGIIAFIILSIGAYFFIKDD